MHFHPYAFPAIIQKSCPKQELDFESEGDLTAKIDVKIRKKWINLRPVAIPPVK
jgi:hypothetical protein